MNNKLFIVCPFSCVEQFIRKKYGNDVFFMTSIAAVLPAHCNENLEALRYFLERENINIIYLVNDTSCRFINGIISKNKLFGMSAEQIIEDIYIDHYFSHFKGQSIFNQKFKLAELNIKKHGEEIINSAVIGGYISEYNIEVKGLISSRENNLLKEISIKISNNIICEF